MAEAATAETAFGGEAPEKTISLTAEMLTQARATLSTVNLAVGDPIDAVAIGSPHLSATELRLLDTALANRSCKVPLYACTGRHSLAAIAQEGIEKRLTACGVVFIADTCIVVTPILPMNAEILVTNSGKFAHYTPANSGYYVVFASLNDCVDSKVDGRLSLRRFQ
jgi:predicted aconitase